MSELEILLDELNRIEHLREQARQETNWDSYQAACDKLTNLGRRLELLRLQTKAT